MIGLLRTRLRSTKRRRPFDRALVCPKCGSGTGTCGCCDDLSAPQLGSSFVSSSNPDTSGHPIAPSSSNGLTPGSQATHYIRPCDATPCPSVPDTLKLTISWDGIAYKAQPLNQENIVAPNAWCDRCLVIFWNHQPGTYTLTYREYRTNNVVTCCWASDCFLRPYYISAKAQNSDCCIGPSNIGCNIVRYVFYPGTKNLCLIWAKKNPWLPCDQQIEICKNVTNLSKSDCSCELVWDGTKYINSALCNASISNCSPFHYRWDKNSICGANYLTTIQTAVCCCAYRPPPHDFVDCNRTLFVNLVFDLTE